MTVENIKQIFRSEFSFISEKFQIFEKGIEELKSSEEDLYFILEFMYWKENQTIKVGRHLTNSRKRALEHIRDNTNIEGIEMKNLATCEKAKVLLFNVKKAQDNHWIAAVEIFMEKHLNPRIRSKRQG